MSREAPTTLGALCFSALVLFCGVSFLLQRTRGTSRERREALAPGPVVANAALVSLGAMHSRSRTEQEAEGKTARERPTSAAEESARASVAGRLILDGQPPSDGARVLIRSAAGTDEGVVSIDPEGRFWLEAGQGAQLSFELPSMSERRLLVPQLELRVEPGRTTELDLDWKTKHVNLRVLGDPAGWNRARVHVTGPDCDASFETDEDGEARLSLVGAGLFTFRALQPSGCTGTATLELDEGAELDSVVIRVVDQPDR